MHLDFYRWHLQINHFMISYNAQNCWFIHWTGVKAGILRVSFAGPSLVSCLCGWDGPWGLSKNPHYASTNRPPPFNRVKVSSLWFSEYFKLSQKLYKMMASTMKLSYVDAMFLFICHEDILLFLLSSHIAFPPFLVLTYIHTHTQIDSI